MIISLKNGSLEDLLSQLKELENEIERGNVDWEPREKMSPQDMINHWSRTFLIHVGWAERFEEYNEMQQMDRANLFKSNYPAFSWISQSFQTYSNDCFYGILLGNGTYLSIKDENFGGIDCEWKEHYGEISTRLMEKVVQEIRDLSLTKEEYRLIKLLFLFKPVPYIEQSASRDITNFLKNFLKELFIKRLPNQEILKALEKIETIYSSLLRIGEMEAEAVNQLTRNLPNSELISSFTSKRNVQKRSR